MLSLRLLFNEVLALKLQKVGLRVVLYRRNDDALEEISRSETQYQSEHSDGTYLRYVIFHLL